MSTEPTESTPTSSTEPPTTESTPTSSTEPTPTSSTVTTPSSTPTPDTSSSTSPTPDSTTSTPLPTPGCRLQFDHMIYRFNVSEGYGNVTSTCGQITSTLMGKAINASLG